MPAVKLFVKLLLYYAAVTVAIWGVLTAFPALNGYLPVGRIQTLVAEAGASSDLANAIAPVQPLRSMEGSLLWLVTAIIGALLASFPISRVYCAIRNPKDYDQSLIDTIVMLPMVVTTIVVIVQDSLALSFSLAGIAGAARFRNSMKSSGDLLFMLLAIAIGLAAGIGALELAMVASIAFSFCFVALWGSNYGERSEMKRYMSGHHPGQDPPAAAARDAATNETPLP